MEEYSRAEHLAWAKERALEFVRVGNLEEAFRCLCSDLSKHPETQNHVAINLGARLYFAGLLNSPREMRTWIEGFR